jgi:hypothetical protein
MSAEPFLSSVIEIGIGMAGFAGIIAAIRQREVSTWDPHHRVLLQMLFTAAAAAIFFSLLPTLLAESGLPVVTTWRVGSIALITWFIGAPAYRLYQARQPGVRFVIARGVIAMVVPIILLLSANVAFFCTSWPYLVGILGILVNGFVTFLALLFGEQGVGHKT